MDYHHWLEALHVISIIAWMAGILYLPRFYVYHTEVSHGSETDKLLQKMERRLLRVIINPAMVLTFVSGITLAVTGHYYLDGWFHIKMLFVLIMLTIHGLLAKYRKDFINNKNIHSAKFYRIINESITVLMALIVIMAIVKPI